MSYEKPWRIAIKAVAWESRPTNIYKLSSVTLYDFDKSYEFRLCMENISTKELSVFLEGQYIKLYSDCNDTQLPSNLLVSLLLPGNVLYHQIVVLETTYGICIKVPKAIKLTTVKAVRIPIVSTQL